MFTFYKDKSENFECNIGLEGASLSKAQARLVLENNEYPLIFNGTIDKTGKCVIPIPKLKILSETLKGNLKLEVIVDDDTYFVPYTDTFEVAVNKKLTVEVISKPKEETPVIVENKKKVTATVVNPNKDNTSIIVNEIYNLFKHYNITALNIKGDKKAPIIIENVVKARKVNPTDLPKIQTQLLDKLIKDIK